MHNPTAEEIYYHDHAQFTLGEIRQLDLLHGDGLPGIPIQSPIHGPECASTKTIAQLLVQLSAMPSLSREQQASRGPNAVYLHT